MLIRSFVHYRGRKKGRVLAPDKQAALNAVLPRVSLGKDTPIILDTLFPTPRQKMILDIGFGQGEMMLHQAAAYPAWGFIGAEVFVNSIAHVCHALQATGLDNIRLFEGDVHFLLPHLPDGCLDRIHIFFPDPWPKARHHKRRLIQPQNMETFYRILAPHGDILFASDWPDYIAWTQDHATAHGGFISTRLPTPPADWQPTRYEQKARRAGRPPAYLAVQKISKTP